MALGEWWVQESIIDRQMLISLGKVKFPKDPSLSTLSQELMGCSRWFWAVLVCGVNLPNLLKVSVC